MLLRKLKFKSLWIVLINSFYNNNNKNDKKRLIGGSDFTNQTRSNLRNGSANIKSSLDYNHSRGNSRITIIGSGWARSSNIYHEHQLGLEDRTSKHMSQYLTIDNSLDYEDSKDSIEYERYNSTRNSKNSISFNLHTFIIYIYL